MKKHILTSIWSRGRRDYRMTPILAFSTVSGNHDRKSELTDDRYLVFEITVTNRLVVSKIYLTG